MINRLNYFIVCMKNEKKYLIEDIKEISGIDITEYLESYRKILKLNNEYMLENGFLNDFNMILECLLCEEIIKKMFICVNCKEIQLVKCEKNKYIENSENKIYRIFTNYKNEFFPVCFNCVNDGKTFVTKFKKYFFPENTISYDKFKKIHPNRKESEHFKRNYYVPISDEEDSRYDVLSNLGI